MKTEQTLMSVLCVMCAALVLTALVVLLSSHAAPASMVHGAIQNMPPIIVHG